MDFELPDELKEIRRVVREFAVAGVAPRARAWGASGEFPWEVVRKLGPPRRDATLCEIGEGTSEVQRIVISRDVLR